jgi:hypothetical protein
VSVTLTIIDQALGRSRLNSVKDLEDIAEVLEATQRVVDTLTPPWGGRYIVALKDATTAVTDFQAKTIVITAKPIYDSTLTQGQCAEVLVGLTAHEIGHTIFDGLDWALAVRDRNPHPAYSRLSNLLADHRLEARMATRFPMIGPSFGIMLRWVAKFYKYGEAKAVRATPTMKGPARFDFAVAAVRYPWGVKWSADAATRAERRRWREWADEYTQGDTLEEHLAGLDVAFAWLMDPATPEPEADEPEPIIDEPEPLGPTDDDDDEDDEDDEDEDEDEPFDDDEDEDEPEPGEDESEEGEDEPPIIDEPQGWDDSPPDDWDDEPKDEPTPKGKGEDEADEPDEDGEDEPEEQPDRDGDQPGEGEQPNEDADREEWDDGAVKAPDSHSHATRDPGQGILADRVARLNTRSKIKFGPYGSMTNQWH